MFSQHVIAVYHRREKKKGGGCTRNDIPLRLFAETRRAPRSRRRRARPRRGPLANLQCTSTLFRTPAPHQGPRTPPISSCPLHAKSIHVHDCTGIVEQYAVGVVVSSAVRRRGRALIRRRCCVARFMLIGMALATVCRVWAFLIREAS
jgi:hypothetical protein